MIYHNIFLTEKSFYSLQRICALRDYKAMKIMEVKHSKEDDPTVLLTRKERDWLLGNITISRP